MKIRNFIRRLFGKPPLHSLILMNGQQVHLTLDQIKAGAGLANDYPGGTVSAGLYYLYVACTDYLKYREYFE